MLGNIETKSITKRRLQIKIYLILLNYSYSLKIEKNDIRLWIIVSSQFNRDSHVLAKPSKQTIAMIITRMMIVIMMIVVVEIVVKKSLIIRLYKRLKYKKVRPKNDS